MKIPANRVHDTKRAVTLRSSHPAPIQRLAENERNSMSVANKASDLEQLQAHVDASPKMQFQRKTVDALRVQRAASEQTAGEPLVVQQKEAIQTMDDEELMQGKFAAQMMDDEDLMQGKFASQRMPEEQGASPEIATTNQTGMPDSVKAKMESGLNADFSDVRVHANSSRATEIGALAYTQGSDVHFAPSQFRPDSNAGQQLLGHELAHVVQQREGRVAPTTEINGLPVNDNPGLEQEADDLGRRAAAG